MAPQPTTALPAPKDYYRITRARELRGKAERLERLSQILRGERHPIVVLGYAILLFLVMVSAGTAIPLVLLMWTLLVLSGALPGWAARYHKEADTLEHEHRLLFPDHPQVTELSAGNE